MSLTGNPLEPLVIRQVACDQNDVGLISRVLSARSIDGRVQLSVYGDLTITGIFTVKEIQMVLHEAFNQLDSNTYVELELDSIW